MRTIVTAAGFIALASMGLPAQSAPLTGAQGVAAEPSAVEQVHYRYYRHHRHYRYYRPDFYYYGPRHHRHYRHWW